MDLFFISCWRTNSIPSDASTEYSVLFLTCYNSKGRNTEDVKIVEWVFGLSIFGLKMVILLEGYMYSREYRFLSLG